MVGEWIGMRSLPVELLLGQLCQTFILVGLAIILALLTFVGYLALVCLRSRISHFER